MSKSTEDSKNEDIKYVFQCRKEQIDKELSRIRKLLLDDSVTEISLDIHLKFDKTKVSGSSSIWRRITSNSLSELTFVDQVKKEVKCEGLKTDDW